MFAQMADAYGQLPDGVQASAADSIAITADPQLATEMQRAAAGNIYMGMLEHPQVFNPFEAARRFLDIMRIPQPEKLLQQPQPPQLTPAEKAKALEAMQKAKTAHVQVMGKLAVDITTAIKNLVDANGGTVDTRVALLQAQQLEMIVQDLIQQSANNDAGPGDVAPQSGDPSPDSVPAQPPGGGGDAVPVGIPGGAGDAGSGGRVP